jgi:hypothetical protein
MFDGPPHPSGGYFLRWSEKLRTKARSLVTGIRQSTLAPSLCLHLREELQRIREESAEAWETLRESLKTMERLKEFA